MTTIATPKREDMSTESGSPLQKRLIEVIEALISQVNENSDPAELVSVLGENLLLEAMGMKLEAKINRNTGEVSELRKRVDALKVPVPLNAKLVNAKRQLSDEIENSYSFLGPYPF